MKIKQVKSIIIRTALLMITVTAFGQPAAKTNIQTIARTLATQVPEINYEYKRIYSSDDNGGWDIDEKHYLCRYTESDEYGRKELQMFWYERPATANDLILVGYKDEFIPGFHPWLKCFDYDRKTAALKEVELPFNIPSAHEFDKEEFEEGHPYWRTDYTICETGDVVISAAPSMNANCVMVFRWDKKGSFALYKRGINIDYVGEPIADNAEAEQYVRTVIRPDFQRINAINNPAWTDKKTVWDISLEGVNLIYCYSEKGLEKITASLFGETYNTTVEYYFSNLYLSFIYSITKKYTKSQYDDDFNPEKDFNLEERRWYIKDGFCFRGIGNNGRKLSPAEIEEEFNDELQLFDKILVK